ncbi:hypothetical protein, partial [Serratia fonticola]|uniref:hypothetical protein n=1 Tax=Serratia fonticola TaxID=47917 RepID=UPI0021ADC9D7
CCARWVNNWIGPKRTWLHHDLKSVVKWIPLDNTLQAIFSRQEISRHYHILQHCQQRLPRVSLKWLFRQNDIALLITENINLARIAYPYAQRSANLQ